MAVTRCRKCKSPLGAKAPGGTLGIPLCPYCGVRYPAGNRAVWIAVVAFFVIYVLIKTVVAAWH